MSNRSESLIKAQDKYDKKTTIIRIDTDIYTWIKNFSENNKITIKDTIKMSVKDFKENELIKQENDLLRKEIAQLKIENDLLKGNEKKDIREGSKNLIFK